MIDQDIHWGRRAITTPLWILLAFFFTSILPLSFLIGAFGDIISSKKTAYARTAIFFSAFFIIEVSGMWAVFGVWLLKPLLYRTTLKYQIVNRAIQRHWANALFWGAVKLYNVDITIRGNELLSSETPFLLFCRHASTLDTMVPLAIAEKLKYYRYVMKAELLWDPTIDYPAQRFPNHFVRRGKNPQYEIDCLVELGKDLEPNAAVVIYPEGTRFTEEKRLKLIKKFMAKENDLLLEIAQSLKHTLPPVRDGAIKMIQEMAITEDIIFIAHRGMGKTSSIGSLYKGSLLNEKVEINVWRIPAQEVPREKDAIRNFLIENWKRIDTFVEHGFSQV